jgi:double-stranded uracil-DNA glycosylase
VAPWSGLPDTPYRSRCAALKRAGIGLWDVLASCERKGALDKNIRNPEPNDFHGLVGKRRKPPVILCNGKKAYDLLTALVELPPSVDCRVVPSTSHANARKGKEEAWLEALTKALGSR